MPVVFATGVIGFADPLRSNVPAAVAECSSAGIRVLMIMTEHPVTESANGKQAGRDLTLVHAGVEIEVMSDEDLVSRVKTTSVFARVRPNQKLRIFESLKRTGDVVAMSGDGGFLSARPLVVPRWPIALGRCQRMCPLMRISLLVLEAIKVRWINASIGVNDFVAATIVYIRTTMQNVRYGQR